MSDAVETLFRDLAAQLGLSELNRDADGSCLLQVDSVIVQIDPVDDGRALELYVDLGAPPEWGAPAGLYEAMLEANFFSAGTGGAALGFSREAGFVALSRRLMTSGLTAQDLYSGVETLVDYAEAWQKKLATFAQNAPEAGESTESPSGMRV